MSATEPQLCAPGQSDFGWHRVKYFLQCPRKYALGYGPTAERKKDKEALVVGELVHVGLAHLYLRMRARQQGADESAWYTPWRAISIHAANMYEETLSPLWHQVIDKVSRILRAYAAKYEARDEKRWEILEVEHQLAVTVRLPNNRRQRYTQRVDLMVRDKRGGKVYFIDHKTSFRLAASVYKAYTMDGQNLGYQMLGRAIYKKDFGGVQYNYISKEEEPAFSRPTLERTPRAARDFVKTLKWALANLLEMTDTIGLEDPRAWPGAYHDASCWTRYGECAFAGFCKN